MSYSRLKELENRPVDDWWQSLSNKQEQRITNGSAPVGGQLVSSAINRRVQAGQLHDMVLALPKSIAKYSEEDLRKCDGLTLEMREIAIFAAGMGQTRQNVAKLLGVTVDRLKRWIERGLQEEFPFNLFAEGILRAEALRDLNDENDTYEAVALEIRTSGGFIRLLERRDEQRAREVEPFADLPLDKFEDDELDEYQRTGKVPARFRDYRPDKSNDDQLEEDFSHITIYKLKMKVRELEEDNEKLQQELYKAAEIIQVLRDELDAKAENHN